MSRLLGVLSLAILLAVGTGGRAHAQRFQIEGKAVNAETGLPLDRTWIGLYNSERLLAQTWTDAKGNYELPPVEGDPGLYWIDARPTDKEVLPHRQQIEVVDWGPMEVPLQLGGSKRFALEGTVRAHLSREALEGVWLGLYREDQCIGHTVTDAAGHYLLAALGPLGVYRLEVKPVGMPFELRREEILVRSAELILKDVDLAALPPGERPEAGSVVFSVKGRLLIEGTELSARKATVQLWRGGRRYASASTDWDGRFALENVKGQPGDYRLIVDPEEWMLRRTEVDVILSEKDLVNQVIEVESVSDEPVLETSFTGEVFSAGGGRGLGWVQVYLVCKGRRIFKTWTNDFGRYEMVRMLVPQDEVTLVFLPLNHVFVPLTVRKTIEAKALQSVHATLPTLCAAPVTRVRLRGEITSSLTGKPVSSRLCLFDEDVPLTQADAPGGFYNWSLDLPQGDYRLELNDRHGLLSLSSEGIEVGDSEERERDYALEPTSRFYGFLSAAGLVLLLLAIVAIRRIGAQQK